MRRSRRKGGPRICLGPAEVAGFYGRLVLALRDLGVDAVHANLFPHPFAYPEAGTPPVVVRVAAFCRRKATSHRVAPIRVCWRVADGMASLALVAWAAVRFDVFVFGFGQTFLRLRELPLLKLLGKRIIFILHGSDARPPYLNGAVTRPPCDARDVIERTRVQKRRLLRIERYADTVICDPMNAQLLERPFVLRPLIGRPIGSPPASLTDPQRDGSGVRVLHAPSDPIGKGTAEIRRIFSALESRGHELEFVELQGQPNSAVLEEIARCDLVADQLYTDSPMATLATEAAVLGKPALVGGYAGPDYRAAMPEGALTPTVYVDPDEFAAAADRLLGDAELRSSVGRVARDFVSSHWTPALVAERFLRVVNDDVPREWTLDPAALRYTHGHGLTAAQVRELVTAVVEAGGVAALQVGDKPELERCLVELADS